MAKNKKKKSGSAAVAKRQALNEKLFHNMLGMEYTKGRSDGYMIAVIVMFWILHREHGFGKVRLTKVMKQVNDFCTQFIAVGPDGTNPSKEGFQGLSLQDIVDTLADECQIYIDLKTGELDVDGVEIKEV